MKRILISLLSVVIAVVALHSQTVNFSSVKVKTKTEKEKRIYPYDQFVMLNYGAVITRGECFGHTLGFRYGQVHIGGWYVNADISLSRLHFSYDANNNYGYSDADKSADLISFNRVAFGGGGIVRMVIPLYFYVGAGYFYQNTTARYPNNCWKLIDSSRYSPDNSGYFEFGLQGNIKGFTIRTGFRYGYPDNYEASVGIGWTFARKKQEKY